MSTLETQSGETALYGPVKTFLETLGFDVKGEIGACDLLGLRDGKPVFAVVCELKLQFNLELVLQGVDRAPAVDEVWLAARLSTRGKGREGDRRFRDLCRRLGFGLIGVDASDRVHVLLSPESPAPRRNAKRRSRLLAEHRRREGDPSVGGATRRPIMTAYRQEALRCAAGLAAGASRPRDLRPACPRAQTILARNVYGWFENTARGLYALTPAGFEALARWPQPTPIPAPAPANEAPLPALREA